MADPTPANCFFCCKEVASPGSGLQIDTIQDGSESSASNDEFFIRFFTLASRYFDFSYAVGWIQPEKALYKNYRESTLKFDKKVCKDCFQILDAFCDMYEMYQHLQLELNRSLEKIAVVISAVPSVINPDISNNQAVVASDLQEFKKAFVKQGRKLYSKENNLDYLHTEY